MTVLLELRVRPDSVSATAVPSALNLSVNDLLNEDGYGSFDLVLDDPLAAFDLRGLFAHVTIDGNDEFTFEIETFPQRIPLAASGDRADQRIGWAGRGLMSAVLGRAIVYPPLGPDAAPTVDRRGYNWTAPQFDDSAWTAASQVGLVSDAQIYWAGGPQWTLDFPDPTAAVLWASDGTLANAGDGTCWFRQVITIPTDGAYDCHALVDNDLDLYIDGQQLFALGPPNQNWLSVNTQRVTLTAGTHTVACRGYNTPIGPALNPAGFAWALYRHSDGLLIRHSDPADCLILEYVEDPPGMTIGMVLRLCVEEAQARGVEMFETPLVGPDLINGVNLTFDDTLDTNGTAWDSDASVATQVKTDYYTFARELCATYCDIWFTPGSMDLNATVKGGRGAVEAFTLQGPVGRDPATATVVELVQHGTG